MSVRIDPELERFRLRHGAMQSHGWKNCNWGLVRGDLVLWFGYGDLASADVKRIQDRLRSGEVFVAGWKDQSPPLAFSEALGLNERNRRGHSASIYVTITSEGARFDREAGQIL